MRATKAVQITAYAIVMFGIMAGAVVAAIIL